MSASYEPWLSIYVVLVPTFLFFFTMVMSFTQAMIVLVYELAHQAIAHYELQNQARPAAGRSSLSPSHAAMDHFRPIQFRDVIYPIK